MIAYPLNLIAGLKPGQHTIQATQAEFQVLRKVQLLTERDGVNGMKAYDFRIVQTMKHAEPDKVDVQEHPTTVLIEQANIDEWEKFPAKTAITTSLISQACKRVIVNREKFELAIDSDADYGRIKTYVSRTETGASVRKNTENTIVLTQKDAINSPDDELPVHIGMKRGMDKFFTTGSESYVRHRVSTMNKKFKQKYRVQKLSESLFCIIKPESQQETDSKDLVYLHRVFMLNPTPENYQALLGYVTGLKRLIE